MQRQNFQKIKYIRIINNFSVVLADVHLLFPIHELYFIHTPSNRRYIPHYRYNSIVSGMPKVRPNCETVLK